MRKYKIRRVLALFLTVIIVLTQSGLATIAEENYKQASSSPGDTIEQDAEIEQDTEMEQDTDLAAVEARPLRAVGITASGNNGADSASPAEDKTDDTATANAEGETDGAAADAEGETDGAAADAEGETGGTTADDVGIVGSSMADADNEAGGAAADSEGETGDTAADPVGEAGDTAVDGDDETGSTAAEGEGETGGTTTDGDAEDGGTAADPDAEAGSASSDDDSEDAGTGTEDADGTSEDETEESGDTSDDEEGEPEDEESEEDAEAEDESTPVHTVRFEADEHISIYIQGELLSENFIQTSEESLTFSVIPDEGWLIAEVLADGEPAVATENENEYLLSDLGEEDTLVKVASEEEPVTYESGVLSYRGADYEVRLSYPAEAEIPADARLEVREIMEGTQEYTRYFNAANRALGNTSDEKNATRARFFDITILAPKKNADEQVTEEEVEPKAQVSVEINYDIAIEVASSDKVEVVHFAENNPSVLPDVLNADPQANATGEGTETVESVEFQTSEFSVYGFMYTVIFTYDGYSYDMAGEGSVLLSELAASLNLYETEIGRAFDVNNVESVVFSNADLLSVTKVEGDWLLKSLASFESEEVLTVTMDNGSKFVINVTDPETEQPSNVPTESAKLEDFITNVVISGATLQGETYLVEAGKEYSMQLTFKENRNLQFDNDAPLTYQIPDGILIPETQTSGMIISIISGGITYPVQATLEVNKDGILKIQFKQDDPNYYLLANANNVSLRAQFSVSFDGSANEIKFEDSVERTVTLDTDDHSDAFAEKSAWFDEDTGTYHYTIKVRATGNPKNVNIKDAITGTALIFNNDAQVSGNSSSYTTNPFSGKGFDYTFSEMQDGEEITITYSASLDPGQMNSASSITANMTRNTVTVQKDGGEPHHSEYTHTLNFKIPDKTGGEPADEFDEEGKPLYNWTITYNALALASVAKDKITDTIAETARQYMKYAGNITVRVYQKDGTLSDTRTFQPDTDNEWTYTIPAEDNAPYYYVFEYKTSVDQEAIDRQTNPVTLINTVESPGGKDSAGITAEPKEHTTITKEVESSNTQEVTWVSKIHVPESGLSEAVVTDSLPGLYLNEDIGYVRDLYKNGSLKIDGRLPGESYQVSDNVGQIIITFYKDKDCKVPGLQSTTGGHDITIRLTTEVNQKWLKYGYEHPEDNYKSRHANNININSISATAFVVYSKPDIKKTGVRLENSDTFLYTIVLSGVTDEPLTIIDKYDATLLEIDDRQGVGAGQFIIAGGTLPDSQIQGKTLVNYSETAEGIMITADKLPRQENGEFYPYYGITYYLRLKDGVDLEALAAENGGEYNLKNTAEWGDHESEFDYTTKYNYLDKELMKEATAENHIASYKITYNPRRATLNDGYPVVMTDTMNKYLSIDHTSVKITTSPANVNVPYTFVGEKDKDGKATGRTIGTYIIPDETFVTIEYNAMVIGTGEVTYENTVTVSGKSDDATDTVIMDSSGSGEGSLLSIKALKVDEYDGSKKLAGVKFRLYTMDGTPLYSKSSVTSTFIETDANGILDISFKKYGFSLVEGVTYYLEEIDPPEGYARLGFPYQFTLTSDMAKVKWDDYIYFTGETFQIKNKPLEGLIVEKIVDSKDEYDLTKEFEFEISILNEDGEVDTSVNKKYGKLDFTEGKATFKLKNKGQISANNMPPATRFRIEEKGAEKFTVSIKNGDAEVKDNVITGITSTIPGEYTFIRFTNKMETTELEVEKKWENADGSENWPDSVEKVTIQLTEKTSASAEATNVSEKILELNKDKTSGKFEDLPKYTVVDGKKTEIIYGIRELNVPGYATVIGEKTADNKIEVTNQEVGSVKVTKVFSGITKLPDDFKITAIYKDKDGTDQKKVLTTGTDSDITSSGEGTAASPYTWKIENLLPGTDVTFTEEYIKVNGCSVSVTVNGTASTDDKPQGTAKVKNDGTIAAVDFINKYTQLTSVSGTKTWNDGGKTHTNAREITLTLKRTQKPSSADSTWETVQIADPITFSWKDNTYKYENLPKYNTEGVEYEYKVEETPINGYVTEQTGNNFVNTELTEIEITKKFSPGWPDGAEVEFTLSATVDGKAYSLAGAKDAEGEDVPLTQTATEKKPKVQWEKLRKYTAENKEIRYSAAETKVKIGDRPYTGDEIKDRWNTELSDDGKTLTNTNVTVNVTVKKEWAKGDDPNKHPDSITYTLSNDKDSTTRTAAGLRANNYAASFTGLPKYDDTGALINYTVKEVSVPNYTMISAVPNEYAWTFTNKLGIGTAVLQATKQMAHNTPLGEFSFTLTALNGAPMPDAAGDKTSLTVSNKENEEISSIVSFGEIEFSKDHMAKDGGGYEASKTFRYEIEEVHTGATEANNYVVNGVKYDPQTYTAEITVTYDNVEGDLIVGTPVYKKADGTPVEAGAVFTNDVVGSLKIKKVVRTNKDGMSVGSLADGTYTFTVYADQKCETAATHADGTAIETLQITIKNGTADPIEVANMLDGTYYVKETASTNKAVTMDTVAHAAIVKAGVTGNDVVETDFATVTNTYELTEHSGTKTWNDGGKTHDNASDIKLTLKRTVKADPADSDWETVTAAAPITFGWTGNSYKYENLPKFNAEGLEYTYKVEESAITNYVTEQNNNDFVNTELTSISKTKKFTNGWPAGAEVEFTLSAKVDGTDYSLTGTRDADGNPVPLTKTAKADSEKVEWTGIRKYTSDGKEIVYSVTETKVTIGENVYTGDDITARWTQTTSADGTVLTNTDVIVDISVAKAWAAGDDLTKHPDSITYTLHNDKDATTQTADGKKAEGYSASFTGLRKYDATGALINYTVTEGDVEDYTLIRTESGNYKWTFTNKLGKGIASLQAKKRMMHDTPIDTYSFTLTAQSGAPMPAGTTGTSLTRENDENGDVFFGEIEYNTTDLAKAGGGIEPLKTFTYTIEEVHTGATEANNYVVNGVKYDPQTYTAEVTVHYDSKTGEITVDRPVYKNAAGTAVTAGAVFTNDVVGSLKITKEVRTNVEGVSADSLADGTYTFKVYTDAACTTEAKHADNTAIEPLTLTITGGTAATLEVKNMLAGTYYVQETAASNKAVTMDTAAHSVIVKAGVNGSDVKAEGFATVTNEYELTEISGTKTWNDESGKAHDNASLLTLKLERTAKPAAATSTWETVTVSSTTKEQLSWTGDTYRYTNLAKYNADGTEYEYRVTETAVTGDYVINESVNNFVNTAYTSASKTKEFAGGWPANATVEFTLSATVAGAAYDLTGKTDAEGNVLVLTQEVTETNPTAVWNRLKKYDENGSLITYSISETKVTIGENVYTGDDITEHWTQTTSADGTILTNTDVTVDISVVKAWAAGDDLTKHPDSITYMLSNNKDSTTRTAAGLRADNYAASFTGLRKYDAAGALITYTVTEGEVEDYTLIRTESGNYVWTFTNRLGRGITTLQAKKRMAHDTPVGTYSFTLTALDGAPMPAGTTGTSLTRENDENGDIFFGEIEYFKTDLARPDGGTESQKTFTYTIEEVHTEATEENNYVVDGVKYDAQTYTAEVTVYYNSATGEITVDAPVYKNAPGAAVAAGAVFTNDVVGSLKITKEVRTSIEGVNVDSLADGTYTFKVYTDEACTTEAKHADNTAIEPLTLTIRGGAAGTLEVSNMLDGTYYVKETASTNKAVTMDTSAHAAVVKAGVTGNSVEAAGFATVTNTYELTEHSGTKTWVNETGTHNNAGELTLVLERTTKADPTESDWTAVTINAETRERLTWDGNSYKFTNLDKKSPEGETYTYRARETAAAGDYVINQNVDNFVNTAYTSASKTKEFTGGWPADATVEFTLGATVAGTAYSLTGKTDAEGNALVLTQEVTATNPTAVWNRLKKYDENGSVITYSISETRVTIGENVYTGDDITARWTQTTSADGATLTNTDVTVDISVAKAWDDGEDTDRRPDSITYTLHNDKDDTTRTAEGKKEEGYSVSFMGLRKYDAAGALINYTVTEGDVEDYSLIRTESGNYAWTFTNKLGKGFASLQAKKRMAHETPVGTYSFTLSALDGAPMPAGITGTSLTRENDENGDVFFGEIGYTTADLTNADGGIESRKTFTYTIEEVHTGAAEANNYVVNGAQYDPQTYTVEVTVHYDSTTGEITVDRPVYKDASGAAVTAGAVFTNDVAGSLKITKEVRTSAEGVSADSLADGTYTFKVYADEACTTEAKHADNTSIEPLTLTITDGAAATLEVTNMLAGTYYVQETASTNRAVTMDTAVHAVIVKAGISGSDVKAEGFATVTNEYELTEISGTKTWNDESGKTHDNAGLLTLRLERTAKPAAAASTWETVTVSSTTKEQLSWAGDTYRYTNLAKYNADGTEYEYRVTETAVTGDYVINESVNNFVNTAYTNASKTKEFADGWPADATVEFTLSATAAGTAYDLTGKTDAEGNAFVLTQEVTETNPTAVWNRLKKYDENGSLITYSISETKVTIGENVYTGDDITEHWTQTTSADGMILTNTDVTVDINVVKAWASGDDLTKHPDSITYTLGNDKDATTRTAVGLRADNYAASFTGLRKYDAAGALITYTVTEGDVPYYTLVRTDSGEYEWMFTNRFAKGTASLQAKKRMAHDTALGVYSFTLTALDGAPMPEGTTGTSLTRENNENGDIFFGEIEYFKTDLAKADGGTESQKTFTYTIEEVHTEATEANNYVVNGVKYDTQTYTAEVTVHYNSTTGEITVDAPVYKDAAGAAVEAGAVFTNEYDAVGEASLEASKAIEGSEWPEGAKAVFTVTAAAGVPLPENSTVALTEAGKADFGKITYTLADAGKTYTYTITETPEDFGAGWLSDTTITATVRVGEDNGDGTLTPSTVTYDPEDAVITNRFEGVSIRILKVDVETGEPLAGAHMQLLDSKDNVIEEWISTTEAHEVAGLKTRETYTLVETQAPRGYNVTVHTTFRLKADGTIDPDTTSTHFTEEGVLLVEDGREDEKASLAVTKHLIADDGDRTVDIAAVDQVFYVQLFYDEHCTIPVSDIRPLEFQNSSAATVVFENLEPGRIYYVQEVTQDGEPMEVGAVNDTPFIVAFENNNHEVKITTNPDGSQTFSFYNEFFRIPDGFYKEAHLTVTKQLLSAAGEPVESDEIFFAGIFNDAELTELSDVVEDPILVLDMSEGPTVSATTNIQMAIGESYTLYIAEVDGEGIPVSEDPAFAYIVTMDRDEVTITEENLNASVTITNTEIPEESVTPTPTPTETPVPSETPTPTITPAPTASPTPPVPGARTGDDTHYEKYLILFGLAMTVFLFAAYRRRRQRER